VAKIPEEKINEIRQSVDIVDIISDYVQLKKQGRNYFGLCPFHGENTPSFSVSPEKQIFHCFGCGAGGNVFTFLMDYEGISFQEAVIKLAQKSNIPLNIEHGVEQKSQKTSKEYEQMIEAHELLRKFYHHLLINTKEGQEALEYLKQRGFTLESIEKFQIGWSLPNWDFVAKLLKRRGYSLPLMEKAGLLVQRNNGEFIDRFRNRIMFPIFDEKGRTIAFSGRALDGNEPKYLNSPETIIFHKSKVLYNFHHARSSIRKFQQVVLFEGFADVISADRAGITNGVAVMGTSLTEHHALVLRRMTDQVIICYDSDDAGTNAAFKAAELLQQHGCQVKIAQMPMDLDPDDYVQKYGAEKFRNEVIDGAMTFMAFKFLFYRRGKNLQNEGDRLQYIEELLKEISKLPRAVERDLYLRQLAEEFSLSLEALKSQQRQIFYAQKKKNPQVWKPKTNYIAVEQKLLPAYQTAERRLIAHMLKSEEVAYKVKDLLAGQMFNIDEHQIIFTYLLAYYEEGYEPNSSQFLNYLRDERLRAIVAEIAMIDVEQEDNDQVLQDYVYQVIKQQKMMKIKEKEVKKLEAERQKNHLLAAQIAMEIIELRKSL
jgi:DNA primase